MVGDVVIALRVIGPSIVEPREHVVVSATDRDLEMAEDNGIGLADDVFVAAEAFELSGQIDGKLAVASHAAES